MSQPHSRVGFVGALPRTALPAVVLGLAALLAASPAQAQFTMADSLRDGTSGNASGGAFGPDGWTVTDRTDRIWWALPTLVSGSIEFTVAGVTMATMPLTDYEFFTMYEAGYGMTEPINYDPEYRENHYKAMLRVYGQLDIVPERQGTQKLMWGICPSGTPGYGTCGCDSFFGEPFGGDPVWDGSPQRLGLEWGDGHARFLRNGAVVHDIDYSGSGLEFGPASLHFSLGSPRAIPVAEAGLPVGAVFSDLAVEGVEGEVAACPGGGDGDADVDAETDVAVDAAMDAEIDVTADVDADAAVDDRAAIDDGTGEVADRGGDTPVGGDTAGGGCGCRTAGGRSVPTALWPAVLAWIWARRRRSGSF
jgi:MYXO-CTERM domain-containing protein